MLLVKRAFSVRQGKWLLLEPLVSGGMQSTSGNCRLFIVYSVSRRGWLMATLEECASWPPWRSVPHGHLGGVCLMATLEECASWPPWRSMPHGHLGGVCLMVTLEECASWPPWRSVPLQFIQATSWNLNEDPRLIIVKWPIKRILKSKYPSKGYSFINFVFNCPLLGSSLYHLPITELMWASSVTNQIKMQHLW